MDLAARALEAWGIRDAILSAFAESPTAVYEVEPGPFTLRIGAVPGLSDEAMLSQLVWLKALSEESGLQVPEPQALPDGTPFTRVERQRCVLLRWIEGESLLVLEPADAAREVGMSIGRMHAHSRAWTPPPDFRCRSQELHLPAAEELELDDREHAELAVARDAVQEAMDELGAVPATQGLVHGDLNFRNFVWSRGQACPIDFDEFAWGFYLSDLAEPQRVITHYPDFDELQAALLEGYSSQQELSSREEKLLPRFIVGTFLAALSWACRPACAGRRAEVLACLPGWRRIIRGLLET